MRQNELTVTNGVVATVSARLLELTRRSLLYTGPKLHLQDVIAPPIEHYYTQLVSENSIYTPVDSTVDFMRL